MSLQWGFCFSIKEIAVSNASLSSAHVMDNFSIGSSEALFSRFEMGFHHMHDDHNHERSLAEDKGQNLPNYIPTKKAAKSTKCCRVRVIYF